VRDQVLTLEQLVDKICLNPAKIAGISEKYESIGGAVLVDPNLEWQVTTETMLSNGKNTPFFNEQLQGRVVETFFA
ncbi:MAG: aspartate carbamoyltransferase, partial [Psychrobacter sp.]|nr:aspartate carbamoyltransferase [Psychrobacter sp.]